MGIMRWGIMGSNTISPVTRAFSPTKDCAPCRSLSLSLSHFVLLLQSLEENGREEDDATAAAAVAVALCQKQNDAGNLKESAKDNSGGGGGGGGGEGGREDNEKAGRREGDVGGENGGINVDNDGGAPGIRPTKSPTMRRKIRHARMQSPVRCSVPSPF